MQAAHTHRHHRAAQRAKGTRTKRSGTPHAGHTHAAEALAAPRPIRVLAPWACWRRAYAPCACRRPRRRASAHVHQLRQWARRLAPGAAEAPGRARGGGSACKGAWAAEPTRGQRGPQRPHASARVLSFGAISGEQMIRQAPITCTPRGAAAQAHQSASCARCIMLLPRPPSQSGSPLASQAKADTRASSAAPTPLLLSAKGLRPARPAPSARAREGPQAPRGARVEAASHPSYRRRSTQCFHAPGVLEVA